VRARGPQAAPLPTAAATARGSWAVVPIGPAGAPSDTFWQLVYLPSAAASWSDRTPPDVADNGGLVIAPTTTGLATAFRPSAQLRFSPLAVTVDAGTSYQPGLIPAGVAASPDALSVAPRGSALALTSSGVLASPSGLTGWKPLTDLTAIAASPAGKSCRPGQITAVAQNAASYVAVSCASATAGILQVSPGGLHAAGPPVPAADSAAVVDVVRLVAYRQGVAALLALTDAAGTRYLATWDPSAGTPTWTESAPLAAPGTLVSTSTTGEGGFVVLSTSPGRAPTAASVAPGDTAWTTLPAPPATTTVIASIGTRVDALSAGDTSLVVSTLTAGRWQRAQVLTPNIPFGSSN
jgi:hypothetical protein